MARIKSNPSTSVTFRMPNGSLHKIDELATLHSHDRTTEIVDACKYWIEIGGASGIDTSTKDKITNLHSHIISLEASVLELSKSLEQLEENNRTLIRIIENMTNK